MSGMTLKLAPCLPATRPLPPSIETSRGFEHAPRRHAPLVPLVRQPWLLRVGSNTLVIRGCRPRDLEAVAAMHGRCSAQSLLDRYRLGGRGPSVAALQHLLRRPLGFVAAAPGGHVVGFAVVGVDPHHGPATGAVGVIVEDGWHGQGIGRELTSHLAGSALVCGYTELVAYIATSVVGAQRLLVDIGSTRIVQDAHHPHLHTSLPETAALGLGAVRERLAS